MNGCNMSFNTTEALQRHLQRHFDRTPPPTPTPPKPVAAVKATKNTKKTPCPAILSDDFGCSSLSQSADEDYLLEMEEGPEDSEASDDSYVPRNQGEVGGYICGCHGNITIGCLLTVCTVSTALCI